MTDGNTLSPKVRARRMARQWSRRLHSERTALQRQSRRVLSMQKALEQRSQIRDHIIEDDAWLTAIGLHVFVEDDDLGFLAALQRLDDTFSA